MRFRYVQGMPDPDRMQAADDKRAQEADMMYERVRARGPDALSEYQDGEMMDDEDSPEMHQEMMARGRKLAGPLDGIDMIGGNAREMMQRSSAPRGDGIQQIGDYATQLLERARRQRQNGGRG